MYSGFNNPSNPTLNAMEVIAVGLGLTVFELFERVCEQAQDPKAQ
jgi:hypothetical protein